ncbi:MAG: GntR family transcriptional regulator [Alphaproteobacteria bacterium]|nr:GntR family transcriptional regulator [Alphaproteobacteria bacterium]
MPIRSLAATGTDGIALYLRIAESLRGRIMQGEWGPGEQLPTIAALSEAYGVARITVREAVRRLASEGVLTTARGRGTHLAQRPEAAQPNPGLRAAINDPRVLAPDHAIRILSRRVTALPASLAAGCKVESRYMHVHKLHYWRDTPFALMDIYVEREIHRRFPPGADKSQKLSLLLRDHGDVAIGASRQELTVARADQRQAALLGCPITSPLVRVRRWRTDTAGRVVYACTVLYRGDLFVWDVVEAVPGADHFGPHLIPAAQPREDRRAPARDRKRR